MANRMLRWVEERHESMQQFSTIELHAELCRQEIKELEAQKLDVQDDNQGRVNNHRLERIRELKLELAKVEEKAELNARGRMFANRTRDMLKALETSDLPPPGAEKYTEELLSWMDAVDDHDRRLYLRRKESIMKTPKKWENWDHTSEVLRYSAFVIYRRAQRKLPYLFARTILRTFFAVGKKGR